MKYKIVFSISSFFKTDEQQELLKKVDTHLLIWDHELINLDTGKSFTLDNMKADTIAFAADNIVSKEGKNKQIIHTALYLPNVEFVATEYELPEVAVQNVASALNYQVDELLPAYPGQLMLAVNHIDTRETNIALWLDRRRTEELFSAFKEQGIELTTIIPRIALSFLIRNISAVKNQMRQFIEHDENGLLHVVLENQSFLKWRSINNIDMKEEAFFQQWQKEVESVPDIPAIESPDFWQKIDRSHLTQLHYSFFPDSARQNLKKRSRLKKGRLAIIVGIIAALLLATPFIQNSMRTAKWEKRYQEYKEKTAEVRNMRSSVTQFEDSWALFNDYPRADVVSVIKKLDTIIPQNSWIKGFEIKGGLVEIDGYSPNPTGILELISQQPEFEQAAFNQKTRSERGKDKEHFGITFRISDINLEAYQEKYFPVN